MELTHRFSVPTDVEETWAHFQDIAAVAECFPGATVTSVDGESFAGSVKVKLGPIALVYNGSGTFTEKDEAAHRFVVEAKGKDKRGNGTAGATVTLAMTASGDATDVEVLTDLAITGKPAQFGRGVMQDVSDKLLGQFVDCLEQRLSAGSTEVTEGAAATEQVAETAAPETAAPLPESPEPSAPVVPDRTAAPEPEKQPERQVRREPPSGDDALDLGATVLPVLAKSYWRQAAGLGVLVLVVWWLARRRSS